MPELKRTFTGGKMNKDADERIVPRGEYKEALNIEVATSEDSDVGAAQNILGNVQQTSAVSGRSGEYEEFNRHIAHVIDSETDSVYRFINTEAIGITYPVWMDRIVEFNTITRDEKAVLIDIYKVRCKINSKAAGPCDHDVTVNVVGPINQLRWGMQVTAPNTPDPITVENEIYIKEVIWSTKTFIAPGIWSIDLRLNVMFDEFTDITTPVNIFFHGDRVLNFSTDRAITGLNIIDGMLFWTDDYSEPKKINIERSKQGSTIHPDMDVFGNDASYDGGDAWRLANPQNVIDFGFDYNDFNQHTSLVVNDEIPFDAIIDNELCTGVPSSVTASWDCVGNACVDPGDGSGQYTSYGACNNACSVPAVSWNCAPLYTQYNKFNTAIAAGVYVEEAPAGTVGQFSTIQAAELGCGNWVCVCPNPSNTTTILQSSPQGLVPGCYTYGQVFGTQYNTPGTVIGSNLMANPPCTTCSNTNQFGDAYGPSGAVGLHINGTGSPGIFGVGLAMWWHAGGENTIYTFNNDKAGCDNACLQAGQNQNTWNSLNPTNKCNSH